jgi:hypothetical protein
MYDPQAVLKIVDAHTVGVLALAGITIVGMAIWFQQAFVVARRDRAYAFPMFCTAFWFAHDTSYVARFSEWFDTYDHWFLKLFWFALVVTSLTEMVYIGQTIRYGGREFPRLSHRVYSWLVIAAVASGVVIWTMVKAALGDGLYLIAFGLTVAVYPPFAFALTLRRQSLRGQSALMWLGFTLLAVGWFSLTTVYFGPTFQSWQWITLGVFSVLGGLAGVWLVASGERYGLVGARSETGDPQLVTAPTGA